METHNTLSAAQWEQYQQDGFVKLGKLLNDHDLTTLQTRIDDIMLGRADVDYDRMLMQLDSQDGQYQNVGEQSKGFKEATLSYRKIQDLEYDPLFLSYMQRPIFRDICARVYGEQTPIAAFRAMFMNKPAHRGTLLPWHQDRWTHLDRDPQITLWTALDPVTIPNGCVQVIVGSHRFGLLNPAHPSGFLTEEQVEHYAPDDKVVYLELAPGEVVLLHNWLLHRSDTNTTDVSRRAFSVCYMDAGTHADNGEQYPTVF
ncbi:MAG: phytanoyl-CoA dioxygenase family protein [Chloroflexi bacterium AL-W]|nr:phytanoyl-CoA dioxygenase family protein [Chloroflexi bacterium AL-N1]NOK64935.1 phytanoyl-CoA dioxygenase family protein [Chloroflexi bacterium AL-N10]NOK76705.1 phytanoyl-CoA dioxygenase family protein [Chloroflexi bacterium AL-N5]NOK84596.1 phytanoyl-CoA dioxygenase family protein [Chloroflexi bacterium AL-W]NOK86579.1 phytanoyl-CoA dioxygenase family protein [Chloroflexi bacterium AL-N15]